MNKFWMVLIGLVAFGGYWRMVRIAQVPPHLGNDEISIAYDSYSIRTTGRDEHGHFLPLSFESHRTYKAPLYAYWNIPFNMWLGNTEAGVRYLSAVSGMLAILLVALIGREIGGNFVGLVAGFLMMVTPKSIIVSRIGFEANLAASLMLGGIWQMLLYSKVRKLGNLLWAGFFLGCSIWGYHTQWGLAPMVAVAGPWWWRREINLKRWWPMWLLMALLTLPIFINFFTVQLADVNNRANSQLYLSDGQFKDFLADPSVAWWTKMVRLVMVPINNYILHFSLAENFGFGSLMPSREPLDSGWYLLVSLPLVLIGIFKGKTILGNNFWWILCWWFLCPVVPSLTIGGVTSVRNLSAMFPMMILAAAGWRWCQLKSVGWGRLIMVGLILNFWLFARAYFIHFPVVAGDNFQYGYKQAWEIIKPIVGQYSRVVVEPKFGRFGQYVGVPHLYFGYFQAFTPEEMLGRVDDNGTYVGKFEFREVDWNRENVSPNSIYIVSNINPVVGNGFGKLELVELVRNPDGVEQFLIYKSI